MKTNRHMLRFGVAGMLLWCVMLVHATCLSGLQPFFPGGENAFREYVNANFRVNKRDMSEGIGVRGSLRFRLVIGPKGDIVRTNITLSLHPKLDREMLRVLKQSPRWRYDVAPTDTLCYEFFGVVTVVFRMDSYVVEDVCLMPVRQIVMATTAEGIRCDSIALYRHSFDILEQMPDFPGGHQALMKYIKECLYFPMTGHVDGIQGRVIVTFIVDEEGFVCYPVVAKSLDPPCDEEALQVVRELPRWIPGKKDGKNVVVKYTIPVNFSLL